MKSLLPALAAVFGLTGAPVLAAAPVLEAMANQVVEASFSSKKAYADPFSQIDMDVVVSFPNGRTVRVPAFWSGRQIWKFRFAAPEPGAYTFQTECSDERNTDLHGVQGAIHITPYQGTNLLHRHGPLRIGADGRHFEHLDGTPFLWLADTWWMGFCKRLDWPAEFQTLTADRVGKGFNVIQIVAGLYPDMPAFDPRGANEAGFPWTTNYTQVNPAYFDAADRRLQWMVNAGLVPCVVGAWGYHLPWLGVEQMEKHWRYLVARWGAYPVVWCVAGEAAMPYYLSETKEADRSFQIKGWTEVARYLRRIDPFSRLITIHPSDTSRRQVEDPAVIDFEMLQTGHGDVSSIPRTLDLLRESLTQPPRMPVINSEVCYEGIGETCFDEVQRFMVWSCLLSGAAGHTYGANGIWQVNRRDQPYGKSPHGGNWGTRPWDEAAALPGSRQTGLARSFLDRFAWMRFEPHPEWASWADEREPAERGSWIWFPEGDPRKDAPAGQKRFFRRSFDLEKRPLSAFLRVAVDDHGIVFLNGQRIGSHSG